MVICWAWSTGSLAYLTGCECYAEKNQMLSFAVLILYSQFTYEEYGSFHLVSISVGLIRTFLVWMNPSGLVSEIPRLRYVRGAALSTHVRVSGDDFEVSLERQADLELLEIKINIPQAWADGKGGARFSS